MALPTFQAAGTAVSGTGAVTPAWPTHAYDDVALLIIQTANETVTLTTANGFAQVANSPQGTGVAGILASVGLAVYWCRATSTTMASPVVADPGDHVVAQILTFRNVKKTGNPYDGTAGGVVAAPGSTAVSAPGGTLGGACHLIVAIAANATDSASAQTSGWANADLVSITELVDTNVTDGVGGGFGVAAGARIDNGAYAATTATLATTSAQALLTIELLPSGPYRKGVGTTNSTTTATPAWGSHVTDDIALLVVESDNEAVTLSDAQGFVEVADSPQGTGTAGDGTATRITAFWCRATSASMTAPTVADAGDHINCRMYIFRGCITTGDPWDVTAGDVASTASTAVSIPGDTTTVDDCLVVAIATNATDTSTAQGSGAANASLQLLAIINNNVTTGNGGGSSCVQGWKATAGAYSATTLTLATSSKQGRISIALRPPIVVSSGTLAVTEAADTIVATGVSVIVGVLAATEANDTIVATGVSVIVGVLAKTEGADTLASAGVSVIAGTLAATEAADTIVATGVSTIVGTLAVTEAADTIVATGVAAASGVLAVTEDSDTIAATGVSVIAGILAVTEDADTVSAIGVSVIAGVLTVSESSDTLTATGISTITGVVDVTESADTLAATGVAAATGTLAVTEADDAITATGILVDLSATAVTAQFGLGTPPPQTIQVRATSAATVIAPTPQSVQATAISDLVRMNPTPQTVTVAESRTTVWLM